MPLSPASRLAVVVVVAGLVGLPAPARAEVILQYFETPWAEIEARLPEVKNAGYDALWLPPPTKGTEGARDVGFAVYDRFDLGDRDQRGSVATRYGTHAELKSLVDAAHRFGVRVYFDVVMNHHGNPNTIENVGVELGDIGGFAELGGDDGFPGTSVWDFHVLPARVPGNGACDDGGTSCLFCARQPTANSDGEAFGGNQWRVVNEQGQSLGDGGEVCVRQDGGERRVASMTLAEAMLDDGAPSTLPSYFDGYTHLVRAPRMSNFDDFGFEVSNWSLLGLHDLATEQYANGDGARDIDGRNAILGTPLPDFVRNDRDAADRATYRFGIRAGAPTTPQPEDTREWLIRWIRWLMLDTGADGFRLDAIKHVWPNFYGEDFPGDPIAFNKVIQDTYDEMNGFTDADDFDLVDDAAIFGEDFTGSCDALRPYILGGQRALDFPLFFNIGGRNGMHSGDIGQLSVKRTPGCDDIGAFGGLNRLSGIGFVQSHDECGSPGGAFTNSNADPRFSRCEDGGSYRSGATDLSHAFTLTRDADAAVFYDGNRWTSLSFVRSGRADALADSFFGARQTNLVTAVRAARRVARGTMENLFVGNNAWAYERDVDGDAAGIIVLNDGEGGDVGFGNDANQGGFIATRFVPGTVLRDLTGNATFGDTQTVLDPELLPTAEQPEVQEARNRFATVNGGQQPPAGHGVVFVGVPARSFVILAPPAFDDPPGDADDVVLVIEDIPTQTLAPGVHALHLRFVRTIAGAAEAHDEVVIAVCVPGVGGAAVCGPTAAVAAVPGDDPLVRGLVEIDVDGAPAARRAVESAGARALPDNAPVERAVVHHVVVDGARFDLRVRTAAALAPTLIAARLDDEDLLPGTPLSGTPERFVDGFVRLRVPGAPAEGEGEGEGEPGEGEGEPGEGEGEPGEGEGEGEPGEGEGEGEPNPDGDDDGDGVQNGVDVCRNDRDPEQLDFDEDGVGDVCDRCPDVVGSDGSGCPALSADERARVLRIALAIAVDGPPDADVDVDNNGVVDIVDLDRAIADAIVKED